MNNITDLQEYKNRKYCARRNQVKNFLQTLTSEPLPDFEKMLTPDNCHEDAFTSDQIGY